MANQLNEWIVMLEQAEKQLSETTHPVCRDKLRYKIEQLSCLIEHNIPDLYDCPF